MTAPASNLELPHVYEQGSDSAPLLLLLHGTGGDENDLVPLGRALDERAGYLSPRGPVSEAGMARWFRRLREGVFDQEDVVARTHQLADFIVAAKSAYGVGDRRLVAVGFSNGANIAAATVLLRPDAISEAILFAAMSPLAQAPEADLTGARVFLSSGWNDPMAPVDSADRLVADLRERHAEVTLHRHSRGHGIEPADVTEARSWLQQRI